MMPRLYMGLGLAALFAAGNFAMADDSERPDRGEERAVRQHGREDAAGVDPFQYMRLLEKLERDLVKAIEADAELAEEIGSVFEEYISDVREQMSASRDARRERAEGMRELMREMREAQADGDRDRARELRKDLTSIRKSKPSTEYIHEELFAELRDMLSEPDVEKFDTLASDFEARITQSRRRGPNRFRLMRNVITTLQMPSEQRDAVREILDEGKRNAAHLKDAELEKLTDAVRNAIVDELDDEQAEAFTQRYEEMLKRQERTRNRADGGRRSHPTSEQALTVEPEDDGVAAEAADNDESETSDEPATDEDNETPSEEDD